jgi:hypothetical protein
MKKLSIKSSVAIRLIAVVLSATLFSFTNDFGGDTYEVHLNNKLLLRQMVWKQAGVADISLDPKTDIGELSVYYSHCGQTGKGRSISIRDDRHKILKEWNYADVTAPHSPMNFPVKELAAFNHSGSKLHLFYSSAELPEGKLLVNIDLKEEIRSGK